MATPLRSSCLLYTSTVALEAVIALTLVELVDELLLALELLQDLSSDPVSYTHLDVYKRQG